MGESILGVSVRLGVCILKTLMVNIFFSYGLNEKIGE